MCCDGECPSVSAPSEEKDEAIRHNVFSDRQYEHNTDNMCLKSAHITTKLQTLCPNISKKVGQGWQLGVICAYERAMGQAYGSS